MSNLAPEIPLQVPPKLVPILEPRQFKIMHGGRGGAKSHTAAQVLLAMGLQRKMRILCVREVQKSLRESSMQVLKDYIERLGLGEYYQPLRDEIRGWNGTVITFTGLKDHTADSIKSHEGADIVWVEEAHSVTPRSWNVLIPTIVRKTGAEIWATFNPDQEDDYVYERFVRHADPDAWVCEINWRDNPWFNAAMNVERLKLKALNDDLYQHVWEGKCRTKAGILFKRHWFKRFNLGEQPATLNKYMATDYAGAPDPDEPDREPDWNEFGVGGLDSDGDLWLIDWWSGQEDFAIWGPAWLNLVRKHKPMATFEEKGVILRVIDGSIDRLMREGGKYTYRHAIASASSKAERALGFAAFASMGRVNVPNTPWGDRFINQCCAFTGQDGKVDDMVDVGSLFGRGIDEMRDALPPATEQERGVKPFTPDWLKSGDPKPNTAKRF